MLIKNSLLILPLGSALVSAGVLPRWLTGAERRARIKCGVKGYADTDNNYFWSASKKLASYAACSARCARDGRCESFGFDERVCMLFDERLAGNFESDRKSDLTFYDSDCNGAATSTAAVKSTASTKAASTSSRAASRTQTGQTTSGGRQTTTVAMPTVTVATATSDAAGLTVTPQPGANTASNLTVTAVSSGAGSLISLVSSVTSDNAPTSVIDGGASSTSGASDGSQDTGSGAGSAAVFPNATSAANTTSGAGSGLISLTAASGNGSSSPITVTGSAPTGVTSGGPGLIALTSDPTTDTLAVATPSVDSTNSTDTASNNTGGSTSFATNGTTGGIVGASNVTTSSTTSASTLAIPDGCDIPASITVTSFSWFNSSSNLDCVQPNYTNGSQVCYDDQKESCDPAAATSSDNCICKPFCSEGVPPSAYQLAAGLGPADTVSVTLGGSAVNATCTQSNPPEGSGQRARHAEVGAGGVHCGNATLDVVNFFGDSSSSSSSSVGNGSATGTIDFHRSTVRCDGRAAIYGASFPLLCEGDADENANCTTALPLTLSLIGFT